MFGVHWVWILLLLIMLIGVISVVLAAIAFATRGRQPAPSPVISPDGRFWWDGREWRPLPDAGPRPTPPTASQP